MDAVQLTRQIKNRDIQPFYLLHGEERYAVERMIDYVVKQLLSEAGQTDLQVFDTLPDADTLIAAASTPAWFSDYKLVIVRDEKVFGWTAKSPELAKWAEYCKQPCPGSVVVFVHPGRADARTAMYKLLAPGEVCCPSYSPEEASAWLLRQASARGGSILKAAADQLVDQAGCELWTLHQELNMLLAYAQNRSIAPADVQELCIRNPQYRVYQLLDAVLDRRPQEALQLLNNALADHTEPLMLLAAMARQYHQLLCIKRRDGATDAELCRQLNLRDYMLRRLRQQAARLSAETIGSALELLAQTDEAIKTGQLRDAALAVQSVVLRLISQAV